MAAYGFAHKKAPNEVFEAFIQLKKYTNLLAKSKIVQSTLEKIQRKLFGGKRTVGVWLRKVTSYSECLSRVVVC